jgi:hypothetical protein
MQWVDPNTGQPVSDTGHKIDEMDKTKKKTYDLNTQEGHIDHMVDNMDKEAKLNLAEKHGIKWEHNDHDMINHKNMVVALKQHLKANPHLAGAGHLPKASADTETPTGIDTTNNWVNNLSKNDPTKLYELMRSKGVIGKEDPDPRTLPEYGPKPQGNGMGAIMHMKNMMALKKYLKENPDTLDDKSWDAKVPSPYTGKPTVVPNKMDTDFDIKHLLNRISRDEKYAICKRLGIVDRDPDTVPALVKSGGNAIEHARNMGKLARVLEKNPNLIDLDAYGLDQDHKNLLLQKSKHKYHEEHVRKVVNGLSQADKMEAYRKYSKEPDFPPVTRVSSSHPDARRINEMHMVTAVQGYLTTHPDAFEEYEKKFNTEQLMKFPIGNKTMGRALKHFFALKGVGDVANNHDEETGEREWTFGTGGGSWARIEKRKSGVYLSVVDTGKDQEEWNEYSVNMEKVKNWIDQGEPDDNETPDLHTQPIGQIEDALHRNFKHFYTPEVGETLKPTVQGAWEASDYSNDPKELTKYFSKMNVDDLGKLFEKYGIPFKDGLLNTNSNKFKQFMWGNLVQDHKSQNANDYVLNINGKPELFVLHESAKKWTPEERAQARKDILGKNYSIEGIEDLPDGEVRKEKLMDLMHISSDMIPFDLLSDMVISNGMKIKFASKTEDGTPINGSKYSHKDKTLYLDHSFATSDSLHGVDHPLELLSSPPRSTYALDNGEQVETIPSSLNDDMSHELAHALHFHLSEGDTANGLATKTGSKYLGDNTNVLSASYNVAMRTNPKHLVGEASDSDGNHLYYYHKDHWIDSYEGRIYGDTYNADNPANPIQKTSSGTLVDTGYGSSETGYKHGRGAEHFAHSVARYSNALQSYKRWKQNNPDNSATLGEWSQNMATKFKNRGYGTDWDADNSEGNLSSYKENNAHHDYEDEANGFLYHTMSESHKSMTKAINRLLNRSDFQSEGINLGSMTNSYEAGDFARKSMKLFIDIGGDKK